MLNCLAIIPARGGSKGVPRKNLRPVGGVPLIVHSVRLGHELQHDVADVIVSTDDTEIADVVRDADGCVPFLRPAELAQDGTPMLPVVQHAVQFMETRRGAEYDWVLILQPTCPLRPAEHVRAALRIAATTDADSVISVVRVLSHHPLLMKRIEDGYLVPFAEPEPEGTRRQDLQPPAYMRSGCVYLIRRDVIMLRGSIWGERIVPIEIDELDAVNVDSELDLLVANALWESRHGRSAQPVAVSAYAGHAK